MANTKRKKVELLDNSITKDQAETAFANYASADAQHEKINAIMDIAITAIREKWSSKVAELQATKENEFAVIQHYAVNNRDDFGNKKSMDFTHGTIGFRTGTPSLKAAKGFTWKSITQLLKKMYPDFVRSVDEPAKDKILADRNTPGTRAMMVDCGIIVDQAETFFIEPKKEEGKVAA
jgi:phage host-nuclease inhibitor protein Gam